MQTNNSRTVRPGRRNISRRRSTSVIHPGAPNGVVVIGASSGGIQPVCTILSELLIDFPWPIFVVIHVGSASALPEILSRCGDIPAVHPADGEKMESGNVYVAPPGTHMVIESERIRLTHGPRENRARPAIDPLFRSAARHFRSNVVGIILSGSLDDGTAGLFAIKSRHGTTIVQAPDEAVAPSMPSSAIAAIQVDHCLPAAEIGPLLLPIISKGKGMASKKAKLTVGNSRQENISSSATEGEEGTPVPLSCPDCQGPLFEIKNGKVVQYHCIVGHAFSPLSLSAAHADALERAIFVATRTLKERLRIHQMTSSARRKENASHPKRKSDEAAAIERDLKLLAEIQEHI